jgi:hypothetical protein
LQQGVSNSCIFRLVTSLRRHKAGLHVMGRQGLMRGYSNFCSWARAPSPPPSPQKIPQLNESQRERGGNNQIVFSLGKCSLLGWQKSAVTVQSQLYAEPTVHITWPENYVLRLLLTNINAERQLSHPLKTALKDQDKYKIIINYSYLY